MTIVRLPEKRKYRNIPTEVDGYPFASKREAKRYQELKLLQLAGKIRDLVVDKSKLRYQLDVNDHHICVYEGDFWYVEVGTNHAVLEDTKGVRTREYKIKKRLVKALYGVEIREV